MSATKELLAGGALSAAGLYVGRRAFQYTYRQMRALTNTFLPPDPKNKKEEEDEDADLIVRRGFLSWFTSGTPLLLQRDVVHGGGALFLSQYGIFYLLAPTFQLFELCRQAEGEGEPSHNKAIAMTLHTYVMYQMASSWTTLFQEQAALAPLAKRNATIAAMQLGGGAPPPPPKNKNKKVDSIIAPPLLSNMRFLNDRMQHFACDCLLHMLLNDIRQIVHTVWHDGEEEGHAAQHHLFQPNNEADMARKAFLTLVTAVMQIASATPPPPPSSSWLPWRWRWRAPAERTESPHEEGDSRAILTTWMTSLSPAQRVAMERTLSSVSTARLTSDSALFFLPETSGIAWIEPPPWPNRQFLPPPMLNLAFGIGLVTPDSLHRRADSAQRHADEQSYGWMVWRFTHDGDGAVGGTA
jgi:hypothetical protein